MFSVLWVCQSVFSDGKGPHATITHDAIGQSQVMRRPTLPTLSPSNNTKESPSSLLCTQTADKRVVGIQLKCFLVTGRKRSWQRLRFYTCLSVILFTEGICLSACWDTHPSLRADPLEADTPQEQTPPEQSPRSKHPPGSRHPPWEQTPPPPHTLHAGRYEQQAGSTHPTGMHTCLEIFARFICTICTRRIR